MEPALTHGWGRSIRMVRPDTSLYPGSTRTRSRAARASRESRKQVQTVRYLIRTVLGDSMAKRKRRSGQLTPGRDIFISIAKRSLPPVSPLYPYRRSVAIASPILIEDRRRHRPDKSIRPPGAVRKKATQIRPRKFGLLKFANPEQIAMCIRRRTRREIMHATGFAGAKRIMKKPRQNRNFWSNIGC